MRHLKLALIFISFSLFIACDKDRDDISLSAAEASQLREIMLQGEWSISEYNVNGEDQTANFSDFIFVFSGNNELEANSTADVINGTWRVNNDAGSETDSYFDVDFNIFFGSTGKLSELTSNYDVISATDSEVELSMDSSNGDTILLNFSRN